MAEVLHLSEFLGRAMEHFDNDSLNLTGMVFSQLCTGRMGWMAHRKWKEAKQLPGTAGPGNMLGCCLTSLHFLWAIHPIRPVYNT